MIKKGTPKEAIKKLPSQNNNKSDPNNRSK